MSTLAPERTDTETEEERTLLERLDPDHTCSRPGCDRRATCTVRCRSCPLSKPLCDTCTEVARADIESRAERHQRLECMECGVTFCAHQWPAFVAFVPIGGGA